MWTVTEIPPSQDKHPIMLRRFHVAAFAERLTAFKTSKRAIQFPYDRPLPLELIADIAKRRAGNH